MAGTCGLDGELQGLRSVCCRYTAKVASAPTAHHPLKKIGGRHMGATNQGAVSAGFQGGLEESSQSLLHPYPCGVCVGPKSRAQVRRFANMENHRGHSGTRSPTSQDRKCKICEGL